MTQEKSVVKRAMKNKIKNGDRHPTNPGTVPSEKTKQKKTTTATGGSNANNTNQANIMSSWVPSFFPFGLFITQFSLLF